MTELVHYKTLQSRLFVVSPL